MSVCDDFLMKYRSGKCVSSTFLASRGTDTSMNALDAEVNSRLWQCPRTREEKNESSDAAFS